MTSNGPLMRLPTELRLEILRYLLGAKCSCPPTDVFHPRRAIDGQRHAHTAILAVNHQLYGEGSDVLYDRNFDIRVSPEGLIFTRWQGEIRDIPVFPFHRARQLTIKIMRNILIKHDICLYMNLATLCNHISAVSPSLNRVQIMFLRSPKPSSHWGDIGVYEPNSWESMTEYPRPLVMAIERARKFSNNITLFEWCLQPLAQLPLAEECTIEVPPSVQSIESATTLSLQLASKISGQESTYQDSPGSRAARNLGCMIRRRIFGLGLDPEQGVAE